jgi:hypothetical protein
MDNGGCSYGFGLAHHNGHKRRRDIAITCAHKDLTQRNGSDTDGLHVRFLVVKHGEEQV